MADSRWYARVSATVSTVLGSRCSQRELTTFGVARKGETNDVRSAVDAWFTAGQRGAAILVANGQFAGEG
jgi:hypothetical protein